jgi:hypothetical protein
LKFHNLTYDSFYTADFETVLRHAILRTYAPLRICGLFVAQYSLGKYGFSRAVKVTISPVEMFDFLGYPPSN